MCSSEYCDFECECDDDCECGSSDNCTCDHDCGCMIRQCEDEEERKNISPFIETDEEKNHPHHTPTHWAVEMRHRTHAEMLEEARQEDDMKEYLNEHGVDY